MRHRIWRRVRRHWLGISVMAALVMALPRGCELLEQKERELVFRVEASDAGWYRGIPESVEELELRAEHFTPDESLHAWWWAHPEGDAPTLLYLHGVRWNLTGHLFRIEQLRDFGFSVLAIDYRGFGRSRGGIPSETSVYADARVAWEYLKTLQPDPAKRLIYGHSLGGAVAVDLAAALARESVGQLPEVVGVIVESTFTSLGEAAAVVIDTSLPVHWLLTQRFDSAAKVNRIGVPLLVVHGTEDNYVPARLGEALYEAADQPKQLLLVEGANHNNSMRLARRSYADAIAALLGAGQLQFEMAGLAQD
ncbi:alpha/beta hydrolase [Stutzerimonas tarimensis]|uniref:Alpha/beta hydrolase n=1 Tax=Stutzerimonas tarimensis TaxID=1507735 RepID=A0ABV7TAF6_9GAMM